MINTFNWVWGGIQQVWFLLLFGVSVFIILAVQRWFGWFGGNPLLVSSIVLIPAVLLAILEIQAVPINLGVFIVTGPIRAQFREFCSKFIVISCVLIFFFFVIQKKGFTYSIDCTHDTRGLDLHFTCHINSVDVEKVCLNKIKRSYAYDAPDCISYKSGKKAYSVKLRANYSEFKERNFEMFEDEYIYFSDGNGEELKEFRIPLEEIALNVFKKLDDILERNDFFFNLGVIGYTGVGKSTFLNSLRTSFKREFVDSSNVLGGSDHVTKNILYHKLHPQFRRLRVVDIWGSDESESSPENVAVFLDSYVTGDLCGRERFMEMLEGFFEQEDPIEGCDKVGFYEKREVLKNVSGTTQSLYSEGNEGFFLIPRVEVLAVLVHNAKSEFEYYKKVYNLSLPNNRNKIVREMLQRVVYVEYRQMPDPDDVLFYSSEDLLKMEYHQNIVEKFNTEEMKLAPKPENYFFLDSHYKNRTKVMVDISRSSFYFLFNVVTTYIRDKMDRNWRTGGKDRGERMDRKEIVSEVVEALQNDAATEKWEFSLDWFLEKHGFFSLFVFSVVIFCLK